MGSRNPHEITTCSDIDMMSSMPTGGSCTRTVRVPVVGECPVRGCHATLQSPASGKRFPLRCPVDEIKIHAKTFGYFDTLRNIRFEREFFQRNILDNPSKAETHRLGYENSEDALTWNVFARLAKTDRLMELAAHLAQLELKSRPTLYLCSSARRWIRPCAAPAIPAGRPGLPASCWRPPSPEGGLKRGRNYAGRTH
jgi:hypothetical protein